MGSLGLIFDFRVDGGDSDVPFWKRSLWWVIRIHRHDSAGMHIIAETFAETNYRLNGAGWEIAIAAATDFVDDAIRGKAQLDLRCAIP